MDSPAKQFWSITVYDNDTRILIQNGQSKSGVSSVQSGLKVEPDGSTKVFVGGSPPEGGENNWIESNPEKGFLCYLRPYGPPEPYFGRSWKIPDVNRVDWRISGPGFLCAARGLVFLNLRGRRSP